MIYHMAFMTIPHTVVTPAIPIFIYTKCTIVTSNMTTILYF